MSRFFMRFVVALITFTLGLLASAAVGFGWGASAPLPSAQQQQEYHRSADKPTETRSCPSSRRRHDSY